MQPFCPGYVESPFAELAADYPDASVYLPDDFRVEWGPIFHRGRLDGSARVLVIGQDPGQHENVLRRILVGEAGRRVQGFLAKLGIDRSYVLINALLYSVYGGGGSSYVNRPSVFAYRDPWIAGILASGSVEVVVTFGTMAARAWQGFVDRHGAPVGVSVAALKHPTFPESAGGPVAEVAEHTRQMLAQWNDALVALHATIVHKDRPESELVPYGDTFVPEDKRDIPSIDLPAGIPSWMYADDGWARRSGESAREKRLNITITVPDEVVP